MSRNLPCLGIALGVWLLPAACGAVTIVLQDGAQPTSGYAGTADAFVTDGTTNNASPTRNYGGAGAVAVSAPASAAPANTQGEFRSLIQFDLAAAKTAFDSQFGAGSWSVTNVQLGLTSQAPGNAIFNASAAGSIDIRWLANDSWVEGTGTPGSSQTTGLTFNNLGGFLGVNDAGLGSFAFNGGTSGLFTASLGLGSGLVTDVLGGSKATFELLASAGSQVSGVFNARNFTGAGSPGSRPSLSITAVAVPEPGRMMTLVAAFVLLATRRTRTKS